MNILAFINFVKVIFDCVEEKQFSLYICQECIA